MEQITQDILKDLYIARPAAYLALAHHRTHNNKPLSLYNREFLKDMYLDDAKHKVWMKSTQSGVSEFLIPLEIGECWLSRNVFHVLPNDNLVTRFVQNRLDRSISFTNFYQRLLNDTDSVERRAKSVRLKMFGAGTIAYVGSNSTASFTEFPADTLIIDELEECDQQNIPMAFERLDASKDPKTLIISNPKHEGLGIDYEYAKSDKKKWYVYCDKCHKLNKMDFFLHVIEDLGNGNFTARDKQWHPGKEPRTICEHCKKAFNRFGVGIWIAEQKSDISGRQINKIYSNPNKPLSDLVSNYSEGLTNPTKMARFYNADLGLPYASEGAKITENLLNDAIQNYNMPKSSNGPCVMGVDVGTFFHIRIDEVLPDKKLRAVYIGKVREESEVIELFKRYNVKLGVIDAMPEKRISRRICMRTRRFFMCYYTKSKSESYNLKKMTLSVDRTETLDYVKESFLTGQQMLPMGAINIPEYYDQMTAATRVYDERRDEYIWTEGSSADHFHHAEAYKDLAYKYFITSK